MACAGCNKKQLMNMELSRKYIAAEERIAKLEQELSEATTARNTLRFSVDNMILSNHKLDEFQLSN